MSKKFQRLSLLTLALLSVLLCFGGCDTALDETNETFYTLPSLTQATKSTEEIDEPTEITTEEPTKASTEAPTETIHNHSWLKATCTTPKTCSSCGETEGEAGGHTWRDATCTDAKRCTECDTTEGSAKGHSFEDATCTSAKKCNSCSETKGNALGHSYSGGKCTRCGTADPNYVADTMVWIPTKGGKKYHRSSECSNMEGPIQVTKSEAISQGFDACKRCY